MDEIFVADAGYNVLAGPNYKVGAFAGYFYLRQNMNAFGCTAVANINCTRPVPTSGSAIITEADTWQALRLGVVGEAMVTDRLKISGEAAYLPYLTFNGLDNHFLGNTGILATTAGIPRTFPETSNGGTGVQLEALASYDFTPRLSIGVGARYWAMWTTNGSYTLAGVTPPISFRGAVEQAGTFLQAAYKFSGP